jgi:hypothetical protein
MISRDIAALVLAASLMAVGTGIANAASAGGTSGRDAPLGAAIGADGRGATAVPVAPADRTPKPPPASATPSCAVSDPSALPCRHTDGRGGRR